MNPKKPIIAAVVLIVIGGGAAWTQWTASGQAALHAVGGATDTVWRKINGEAPVDGRLVAYGNVDVRQVNLGFYVGGRLESVAVEEGDRVHAGQVLASLEKGYLEDDLKAAEAKVAAQKATVQRLVNGARPEEIAEARAQVARAEATLELARTTYQRRRELVQRSVTSQQSLDEAAGALHEAQASLRATQASLQLLLAGTRKEDIAAARAQLRGDEAALSIAHRHYADSDLVAPSDGTVLTRVREPGAVLQPDVTVLTVALTKPVWVRAYISEPDLGRVHPGMIADVYTDSRPDHPYRAQVGFISPVAEFTPKSVETQDLRVNLVYRLRLIIPNPDQDLRQGMPVTAVFHEDGAK